jgi:hypothetical protein
MAGNCIESSQAAVKAIELLLVDYPVKQRIGPMMRHAKKVKGLPCPFTVLRLIDTGKRTGSVILIPATTEAVESHRLVAGSMCLLFV